VKYIKQSEKKRETNEPLTKCKFDRQKGAKEDE